MIVFFFKQYLEDIVSYVDSRISLYLSKEINEFLIKDYTLTIKKQDADILTDLLNQ